MDLSWYPKQASYTAIYPVEHAYPYLRIALYGEIGELANLFKKIIRDHNLEVNVDMASKIISELGDICWYISQSHLEVFRDFKTRQESESTLKFEWNPKDMFLIVDDMMKCASTSRMSAILVRVEAIAHELGYDLSYVLKLNIDKLASRKKNNTLRDLGRE